MKKRLGVILATILLGGLASSQTPTVVLIQGNGIVHPGHETAHAKKGNTVRWGLDTGARSWYVIFTGSSPCDGGVKEFGSETGLAKTCSLQNAIPGTYKYSTSDRQAGTKHDPVVIIDPS
jgi:hypothetical protein